MRITGYCERCHKIRTVRVQHFRPRTHVQHGLCSVCEAEIDREREEMSAKRHPANRRPKR